MAAKKTQSASSTVSTSRALADMQDQREQDLKDRARNAQILAQSGDDDESDVSFIGGAQDPWRGAEVDLDNYHYLRCSENVKANGGIAYRPNLNQALSNGYEIAPHPTMPSGKADWPDIAFAILRLPIKVWNARQRAKEKRIAATSGMVPGSQRTLRERDASTEIDFETTQKVEGVSPEDLGIVVDEG